VVPAAATGFNVRVIDEAVSGVYPDWLRELARKSGCTLQFPVVPRARADAMTFQTQQADMLIPASQNQERDQKAQFVHLATLTPALITMAGEALPPKDLRSLEAHTPWRAALVRSYSWGDEYDALVRKLAADNRVDFVNDLETVGRMLRMGRVNFTILPPTLLYSALQSTTQGVRNGEFHYTTLQGLPRSRVGAYLSRQTLSKADAEWLGSHMHKAARDGSLRQAFEKYYPAEVVAADVSTP
jgi:polar amino acid transport system substrate-binding protein